MHTVLNSSSHFFTEWLAAGYERLSKEDDKNDQSSSIKSQRMIIDSFANFNKINLKKHYFDDGYTGSNFNRPGFQELIRDIEAGLINCVIVKDLSRLGRELYETGSYIEEYFLSKNVRFIAINDGYDSNVGDAMLGIRLSVNDLYLRDTSKKIRTTFDAKRRKGEYIATYAKYGYMKNPDNPRKLIPDPQVAPIVVQIFEWMAEGVGTSTIAHRLTAMNIPIPSIYKKEHRPNCQKKLNQGNGIWRPQTVRGIASDQMYLGHMVQGRWKKLSYNSKKIIELPPSQWIVVENTHEPLVSQELFDQVQEVLNKAKKYRAKKEKKHLFQGLLKCKECGHNISIYAKETKNGQALWTECNFYSKYSKYDLCCSHRLNYELFEEDMLLFLRQIGTQFLLDYDEKKILKEALNLQNQDLVNLDKMTSQIRKEMEKNKCVLSKLYEDRLNDVISVKQYKMMSSRYEKILIDLEGQLKEVNFQMKKKKSDHLANELAECKKRLEQFMKFENPTNEQMYQLIDRIEIDKNKNIEVFFKINLEKYLDSNKKMSH